MWFYELKGPVSQHIESCFLFASRHMQKMRQMLVAMNTCLGLKMLKHLTWKNFILRKIHGTEISDQKNATKSILEKILPQKAVS